MKSLQHFFIEYLVYHSAVLGVKVTSKILADDSTTPPSRNRKITTHKCCVQSTNSENQRIALCKPRIWGLCGQAVDWLHNPQISPSEVRKAQISGKSLDCSECAAANVLRKRACLTKSCHNLLQKSSCRPRTAKQTHLTLYYMYMYVK